MKDTKRKATQAKKSAFPVWGWVVIGVIIIAAVMGFNLLQSQPQAAEAGMPAEVSVAQAADLRDQGAYVLDVREQEEWNALHIPDATLIPLGQLSSRLSELPKDQEIVVVCRSGNRSAQGRDILLDAGFTNVTSMAGGMNQWQAQGLPISTGP
ncbi:MAG TPA: rhodanese-like domain-containing protein [Anaerolineaceae bacterium]